MTAEAKKLRYGSLCSGIEAATVAWEPLGWEAAWLSEIDPFPCAVLAHHYPAAANLSDMTAPDFCAKARERGPVDVLVGGTPCQAFSVAGKRESLSDARGNLTLRFVEIADELNPAWIVWENVPGVLNTKDNAFGFLLAGLVGDAEPIVSWLPGGKWPVAGVVTGPRRSVAWRVLDAQYFGLAQRRRRVFVIGYTGNEDGPAAVLFEPENLPRDSAPRRSTGSDVAGTLAPGAHPGGFNGQDAYTGNALVANCIAGHHGRNSGEDNFIAHTLRGEGFDASEDGTGRGTPLVPLAFAQNERAEVRLIGGDGKTAGALAGQPGMKQQTYLAFQTRCARNGRGMPDEIAPALTGCASGGHADTKPHVFGPDLVVRRLTPRECERLQGFPDDYTLIDYRGKPAADGPRYRALGNSMAVPVMAWIGRRIGLVHDLLRRE